MSQQRKRTHYTFTLGRAVSRVHDDEILKLAAAHLDLAKAALNDVDRLRAEARIVAAQELLTEARMRGEQLRLRM